MLITQKASLGRELIVKIHQKLRKNGGVEPPSEFVLMDRSAVGIGGAAMLLKAKINWHQAFLALIDKRSNV